MVEEPERLHPQYRGNQLRPLHMYVVHHRGEQPNVPSGPVTLEVVASSLWGSGLVLTLQSL